MTSVRVLKPAFPTSTKYNEKIIRPDFLSGLRNNGRLIFIEVNATAASTSLYTVPPGKTFYMLSCYIDSLKLGASGQSLSFLQEVKQDITLIGVQTYNQYSISNMSRDFSDPIALPSGSELNLINAAASSVSSLVGFIGYEIDTSLISNFA